MKIIWRSWVSQWDHENNLSLGSVRRKWKSLIPAVSLFQSHPLLCRLEHLSVFAWQISSLQIQGLYTLWFVCHLLCTLWYILYVMNFSIVFHGIRRRPCVVKFTHWFNRWCVIVALVQSTNERIKQHFSPDRNWIWRNVTYCLQNKWAWQLIS